MILVKEVEQGRLIHLGLCHTWYKTVSMAALIFWVWIKHKKLAPHRNYYGLANVFWAMTYRFEAMFSIEQAYNTVLPLHLI